MNSKIKFIDRIEHKPSKFTFIYKGEINKIIIDIAKAITPPNLFGIDRKIA